MKFEDQTNKNETKESAEAPKETVAENVVDKKQEVIDWSKKFPEEISKITSEITGGTPKDESFLEQNMIRKMMVNTNFLSDKAEKSLEISYKEGNAGAPLNNIKQNTPKYIGEHRLSGISEIPKEAGDIESKAMEIIKYCESGLVDPKALKERLQNEIDNARIAQISEKSGIVVNQEKNKPGLEKLQEYAKQLQYVTFKGMLSSGGERGEKWKRNLEKWQGKSQEEVFKNWMNNPALSRDLESDIANFNIEKKGIKGDENISNYRKIKQAEIIGMINPAEAKSLEAGLKEA